MSCPAPQPTMLARTSLWRKLSLHRTTCTAAAGLFVTPDKLIHVPVPMCRRAPVHEACMAEVAAWQRDMVVKINSIGDSFEVSDGGPCRDELLRELTWVLEDTVAEVQQVSGGAWSRSQWRNLEIEAFGGGRRAGLPGGAASERGSSPSSSSFSPASAQPNGASDPPSSVSSSAQPASFAWKLRLRAPVSELYDMWGRRRLELREPFQYLLATAHWREHMLSVSPGVLIPRPETEIFPDLVEQALRDAPGLESLPWADLGTGSGAIAIGAAGELRKLNKDAMVWAVDLSPVAVAHATYNAAQSSVALNVKVVQGSWCDPLRAAGLSGRLGGLLSNPPYIPRVQMAGLQREVGHHEPHCALDGGEGPGMDSLQVICEVAVEMLAPGGFLALETAGKDQAEVVKQLLERLASPPPVDIHAEAHVAFQAVRVVEDCYGVPRFVTATRR